MRLIGPRPGWARTNGGEAGLHPSNIHDTGYAIGAVDLTGDMPVILGPDGPSLGGFVGPAVFVASERWKLGQLRPGDTVRLVAWSPAEAGWVDVQRAKWLARATALIESLAQPVWNGARVGLGNVGDAVLARTPATDDAPAIAYRRAGDRFLLVEYGEMTLDLELRLRVHSLDRWVAANLVDGLVDATPGVRSLLLQVDGERLAAAGAIDALRAAEAELPDVAEQPFTSRVVHLPLSWDDPATREAIQRYMHGVRADAPWCPWNIEFIRRELGRHRRRLSVHLRHGRPRRYQFVGRTVQVWNRGSCGPHFQQPWLLRPFDQLRWFPVEADELLEMRVAQERGELDIKMEESVFRLRDHQRFLVEHEADITRFRTTQ